MSAYRYCTNSDCNAPLGRPTIEEDLTEWAANECPHCGEELDQAMSVNEWLIDLAGDVKTLTEKVAELEARNVLR